MISKLHFFLFFGIVWSGLSSADVLPIVVENEHTIQTNQDNPTLKTIIVPEVELSHKTQKTLYQCVLRRLLLQQTTTYSPTKKYLSQKKLGMNNVPVLDQGYHGTCVTFAVTAAIDAVLNKGNYISQLCSLQLGRHFENLNLGESGWQGSSPYIIFNRLRNHGIISIRNQHQYGCGGYYEYPLHITPQIEMTPENYHERSKALPLNLHWSALFHKSLHPISDARATQIINQTKDAINAGNRVIVSVLLPRVDLGTMGAVAWHGMFYDTWVLTEDIAQELRDAKTIPVHAMVITGYDDKARALDNAGHMHYGLFTLRNSWGSWVGNWGDFYMSYDYFEALSDSAYQLSL